MSLVCEPASASDFTNDNAPADLAQGPSGSCTASGSEQWLPGFLQVSREWLQRLPAHDPRREDLIRIERLAESLVRNGSDSLLAMSYMRTMLCTACRRMNTAQGQCLGPERCLLLNGASP